MKKPQFAERQYESAAHIELARGRASPFVPTQTVEAYIGIDAAADPEKAHAIWRILSVQIPRRVLLSPALWPSLPSRFHDEIPGRFCSLFMQFKRPFYQDSTRARYKKLIGEPYFQVRITVHQQKALSQLETRVAKLAIVRYASPAFWSRRDFDAHDEHRRVLENSAFIAPAQIKSHRKWMYVSPKGKVVLNPEPEDGFAEEWEAVVREMADLAVRQSLRQHVRALASQLEEIEEEPLAAEEPPWVRRISQYGSFPTEDISLLLDLSTVSRAAEAAEASWVVLLDPENEWRELLSHDLHWQWHWRHWWW